MMKENAVKLVELTAPELDAVSGGASTVSVQIITPGPTPPRVTATPADKFHVTIKQVDGFTQTDIEGSSADNTPLAVSVAF